MLAMFFVVLSLLWAHGVEARTEAAGWLSFLRDFCPAAVFLPRVPEEFALHTKCGTDSALVPPAGVVLSIKAILVLAVLLFLVGSGSSPLEKGGPCYTFFPVPYP